MIFNDPTFLLSLFILVPLITGLVFYKKLRKKYQPLIIILAAGFLNEILSRVFIIIFKNNILNSNIYLLIESILIIYLFYNWRYRKKRLRAFQLLVAGFIIFWVAECFVFSSGNSFASLSRMCYSFIFILLAINEINYQVVHKSSSILKNPKFLICIGLIIYAVFAILYEWFYFLRPSGPSKFFKSIVELQGYINAFTNIVFALGLYFAAKEEYFDPELSKFLNEK